MRFPRCSPSPGVQTTTGAIDGCRVALGPAVILNYLLQVRLGKRQRGAASVAPWTCGPACCQHRAAATVLAISAPLSLCSSTCRYTSLCLCLCR